MVDFSKNKWKYSTIGLLAILAVGFSFPQAFAHVTNSISHNVGHIMDALAIMDSNVDDIKAKTDSLPADPASQSATDAGRFTQTIAVESETSSTSIDDVTCESDAGYIVHVLTQGDGDDVVTISVENVGGLSYTINGIQTLEMAGNAGDNVRIQLSTVTTDFGAFVWLKTTEGATASCIVD